MNKILLIIQREYITRVRKRAFIIMTLFVPGLISAMYGIIAYMASDKYNTMHKVYVIDESHNFEGRFEKSRNITYVDTNLTFVQAKTALLKHDEDLLLHIPAKPSAKDSVEVLAKKKTNLSLTDNIQTELNRIATNNKLLQDKIDTSLLRKASSNISIKSSELTETGTKSANIGATYALSVAGAILIYMSIFIYGGQVMRGVIEEKTNRIIEVIVSSVKPFQLMTGKIIGVGLVGLTQFVIWITLSALITKFIGGNSSQSPVMNFINSLGENAGYELACFVFYWLTGYLFYSALFAAVGSAVDSETETQQFMFPITMPLLFTYLLSVFYLFQAPDSPLAFWLSVIPFTAPVAMMVRVPYYVPGWQMALSMSMMVIGFIFTTYVASRIYRVGILMYGKKASYKELAKWFFYKE